MSVAPLGASNSHKKLLKDVVLMDPLTLVWAMMPLVSDIASSKDTLQRQGADSIR
jgi:hypothetical protein